MACLKVILLTIRLLLYRGKEKIHSEIELINYLLTQVVQSD